MTSYSKPTNEQIDAALSRLGSPQHEAYFFARLNNPFWIEPLRARHVFDHPPQPVPVDGGGIRYPHWPPSKYLARMASNAPSEVAAILSRLTTKNVSIIGDLLEAALAMPLIFAAQIIPSVSRAARNGQLSETYFPYAIKLCAGLAKAGEVDQALILADALFTPRVQKEKRQPGQMDEYWYEKGLEKIAPALIAHDPAAFLPKLCRWLKMSVEASNYFDQRTSQDRSYLWRPAIEDHAQNRERELPEILVGFVRDGFEQAISGNLMSLEDAFAHLDHFKYGIFKRLRIHLINKFAESAPEVARRTIMDRDLFDNHSDFKHEYAMLVGRCPNFLSKVEQETWYNWVEDGPAPSTLAGLDDQQREDHVRYWKFKKLHCVRGHLEGDRKAFYDEMFTKCGEPELADLSVRFESGWGHISPMTVEDLAGLTFGEVIERVGSWRPSKEGGWKAPEIEGLASTFERYIARDPAAFSKEARLLIGAPAIYVRTFIDQMMKAVRDGMIVDVSAVLDLCDWVLSRPISERTMPEGRGPFADKDWQWTRDEITSFIQNLCKAKDNDSPKYLANEYRERLWSLINQLCRESVQSNIVKDIAKQDPRTYDYLDVAINSPRGKAVEAALAYARWVADHIKTTEGEREVVPGGLDSMPEVRQLLEWQIAPGNRSLFALAVIGAQLNLIYWIDMDWLVKNSNSLFHLTGIEAQAVIADGWAAWNAFLIWMPPHIEYYRLLKQQYAYAVTQCSRVEPQSETREHPLFHLGQHLMSFYGRGQFGLDDDGGQLRRFLREAHPDIRRHAIGFVGRSLEGEDQLPKDVVNRFMSLWDEYWPEMGRKDAEERPDYWLFGAWFSSGKFPMKWALARLEDFVQVVPLPQPDYHVVKQLAACGEVDIAVVIRILSRMIQGDSDGWRIFRWRDPVTQILECGMQATGETRNKTVDLINYLGRRGYSELGALLGARP